MEDQINTIIGNTNKLTVRIIGGTEDVNRNLYVYEYADEIIIVDCGIGYPDMVDMPGVDVLIPDFTFLIENSHKIKALFITHAHADHIAAIPYLLQELPDIPIYGSKFAIEMIKNLLTERNFKSLAEGTHFHLFTPESPKEIFANFKFAAFGVNHSVPESQAYAIETPEGVILHVSDYKFDPSPVLDKPFDVETVKKYANSETGVLALLSDCLSVDKKHSPQSEAILNDTFFKIFEAAGNRQVFVTLMSSNVSRMYQLGVAAMKYGRKIVASGRSIESVMKIARGLGYLPFGDANFISEQDARNFDQSTLVYVIAGCYGQYGSSLGRLSRGEHKDITFQKDAIVVFSGEPGPPEIAVTVEKMTDALILGGIEVITGDTMENLHVSGHGGLDNMVTLAQLVHPKYFIPAGGSVTKMQHYKMQMNKVGFKKESVFECLEGEGVEFQNSVGKKSKRLNLKPIYISTSKGDELSPQIIKDRDALSEEGVFVVIVPIKDKAAVISSIEVVTRGFVYVKESYDLMNRSKDIVARVLSKNSANLTSDWGAVKGKIEVELERFFRKELGRTPMTIVYSIYL